MLERPLLLWLTMLGFVALRWEKWFSPEAWDPFVSSKPYLDCLIAAAMFAIGSLLPRDEVRQVARRWPTVLGGTAVQYASMPLLAYAVGRLFGFEGPLLAGVIMVGCVPGAMASNVLTLSARANVSYSVSLTTAATLLSPVMVPLALTLTLGRHMETLGLGEKLDAADICLTLLLTVVLPVVIGHLLSRRFGWWQAAAKRVGPVVANLTILWIIAVVVALNRDLLAVLDGTILLALLTINVAGYFAGYGGGALMPLKRPMRRALTLEVGMQNAGLGTFLVLKVFPGEPTAAIPTALYTFGCMFTGTVLARWWAEFATGPAVADGEDR